MDQAVGARQHVVVGFNGNAYFILIRGSFKRHQFFGRSILQVSGKTAKPAVDGKIHEKIKYGKQNQRNHKRRRKKLAAGFYGIQRKYGNLHYRAAVWKAQFLDFGGGICEGLRFLIISNKYSVVVTNIRTVRSRKVKGTLHLSVKTVKKVIRIYIKDQDTTVVGIDIGINILVKTQSRAVRSFFHTNFPESGIYGKGSKEVFIPVQHINGTKAVFHIQGIFFVTVDAYIFDKSIDLCTFKKGNQILKIVIKGAGCIRIGTI